jgi:hypothetical protein
MFLGKHSKKAEKAARSIAPALVTVTTFASRATRRLPLVYAGQLRAHAGQIPIASLDLPLPARMLAWVRSRRVVVILPRQVVVKHRSEALSCPSPGREPCRLKPEMSWSAP